MSCEILGKEELNSPDDAHVVASLFSFPQPSRPLCFYSIPHDGCILLLNALGPPRNYGQNRTG